MVALAATLHTPRTFLHVIAGHTRPFGHADLRPACRNSGQSTGEDERMGLQSWHCAVAAAVLGTMLLVGCGQSAPTTSSTSSPDGAQASSSSAASQQVTILQPADGSTVASPIAVHATVIDANPVDRKSF